MYNRHTVIHDITGFVEGLYRISAEAMIKKWHMEPTEHFDDYLDWVIGYILTKHLYVKVIDHERKTHIYLSIFEENEQEIVSIFNQAIPYQTLAGLRGGKAKVMVNGPDLFIARRMSYNPLYKRN